MFVAIGCPLIHAQLCGSLTITYIAVLEGLLLPYREMEIVCNLFQLHIHYNIYRMHITSYFVIFYPKSCMYWELKVPFESNEPDNEVMSGVISHALTLLSYSRNQVDRLLILITFKRNLKSGGFLSYLYIFRWFTHNLIIIFLSGRKSTPITDGV